MVVSYSELPDIRVSISIHFGKFHFQTVCLGEESVSSRAIHTVITAVIPCLILPLHLEHILLDVNEFCIVIMFYLLY